MGIIVCCIQIARIIKKLWLCGKGRFRFPLLVKGGCEFIICFVTTLFIYPGSLERKTNNITVFFRIKFDEISVPMICDWRVRGVKFRKKKNVHLVVFCANNATNVVSI